LLDGLGSILPTEQLLSDPWPVLFQVARQLVNGHSIYSWTTPVDSNSLQRSDKIPSSDYLLHQCGPYGSGSLRCRRHLTHRPFLTAGFTFGARRAVPGKTEMELLHHHDHESSGLSSGYMFGPSDRPAALIWPLLTSGGPSRSLTRPLVPYGQASRPPRVRVTAFTPHPPHLLRHPLMAMGFTLSRRLTRMPQPSMRFVSLGSELCLRLPSDLASRQAPLPSASSFRHQDLQGTCTPKQLPMPGTRKASPGIAGGFGP
jgi:hypothetical protein